MSWLGPCNSARHSLRPGRAARGLSYLALGHLPVTQITAGIIDRTIDEWEQRHGASTIKNTIAPLVRVLDEAVRDGLIQINPAKNRAKRRLNRNAFRGQSAELSSPRAHAIPDMKTLNRLAKACGKVHQSYSDFVMLAALLAARRSSCGSTPTAPASSPPRPPKTSGSSTR